MGVETALERAQKYGWTIVGIKHDWKSVFDGADMNEYRAQSATEHPM